MRLTEVDVAIVGAGVTGLSVAAELASHARVVVIDRLPIEGGVLGYEHRLVRSLKRTAKDAGTSFMLGSTALRWSDHRLLTAGPGGIGWTAARCLVYAGGSRPATQAELGIAGERLAGVLPATVAVHLTEAGVLVGTTVALLGSGYWARRAGEGLRRQDARVVSVVDADDIRPDFAHECLVGWTPTRVDGRRRVESISLARLEDRRVIDCDAVVLAARVRPLRNVDGAVRQVTDVTFVQPDGDRLTAESVEAQARAQARRAWAALGQEAR